MKLLDDAWRAYRRLVRPLVRLLILGRDRRRLRRALAGLSFEDRLPVFVIVVPNTLGWLEPCLKLVPGDVPLLLIANGLSRGERRRLAERFPRRPQFALSRFPRAFAKHGTVLDLLVLEAPGDFVVLDHDCYVFDPEILAPISWREDEFVAAIDRPGFFTINAATGLRFPRTHCLVLRRERLLEIRRRYGVGCEKATRTPRRVRGLLATIGLGDHNYPPARMAFYDTLQLAISVGLALGWTVRHRAVEEGAITHIGGTARLRNQPGLALRSSD